MDSKLHPAVTVTNIKSYVPILLESDSTNYTTWSEFFRIHCRAFLVSDHLAPRPPQPAPAASSTDKDKPPTTPDKQPTTPPPLALDSWERLDAIVLQWLYGTISQDLINTIFKPNTTAYQAWTALETLFQDNKATRALYLKQKFNNTRLENFANMAAYCQELKVLSNQLANVDAPVDDNSLVLQTLAGLTEAYESISTVLNNTKPLPSFYEVRSQLCMNETRKANQAQHSATAAATALHTSTRNTSNETHSSNHSNPQPAYSNDSTSDRNRGRGSRGRGRGRGRVSWNRNRQQTHNNYPGPYPWQYGMQQWPTPFSASWPTWASPPCPCPTSLHPSGNNNGSGLLGPKPNSAHMAYMPTDIAQAMHTMSLNPPDWNSIMDTGATGHYHQPTGPQDPDPYPSVQQQR
ncbi:putative RNA-directed DNA polymerase [Helianthus annuus]|nr:putative RNA-directed DNA polymerase [Helianthus annuus]KAJ0584906.1 putative RNA-directed DNA polymerase [Helianthus annuus]KAJ0750566.1 putative RNA-directed DNA polymerase [Helianthus annuus]